METPFGLGAHPKLVDVRDHKDKELPTLATLYPLSYRTDISRLVVRMQYKLGTCTAEALCKIIEWLYFIKTGRYVKLSTAFLYIVTKRFIDVNTMEGSTLRSALKAAQKYGVCSEATFPTNYALDHATFVAQELPPVAFTEALDFKIGQYISIPVSNDLIKASINKYGLLYCRFDVGNEWWTPSWSASDIFPLRPPAVTVSGHANVLYGYNPAYVENSNSWSVDWGLQGNGFYDPDKYSPHMTEAWAVTLDPLPVVKTYPPFDLVMRLVNILIRAGVITITKIGTTLGITK